MCSLKRSSQGRAAVSMAIIRNVEFQMSNVEWLTMINCEWLKPKSESRDPKPRMDADGNGIPSFFVGVYPRSEMPGDPSAHAIIGHRLRGAVRNPRGDIRVERRAELFAPGQGKAGPRIPGAGNAVVALAALDAVPRLALVAKHPVQRQS